MAIWLQTSEKTWRGRRWDYRYTLKEESSWTLIVGSRERSFKTERTWMTSWKKENSKHILGPAQGMGPSSLNVCPGMESGLVRLHRRVGQQWERAGSLERGSHWRHRIASWSVQRGGGSWCHEDGGLLRGSQELRLEIFCFMMQICKLFFLWDEPKYFLK